MPPKKQRLKKKGNTKLCSCRNKRRKSLKITMTPNSARKTSSDRKSQVAHEEQVKESIRDDLVLTTNSSGNAKQVKRIVEEQPKVYHHDEAATRTSNHTPSVPNSHSHMQSQHVYIQNLPAHAQSSGGSPGVHSPSSTTPQASQSFDIYGAIDYIAKIKNRFQEQPDIYNQFMRIFRTYQKMKDVWNFVVPTKTYTLAQAVVMSQVEKLFENEDDLLQEFYQFLRIANAAPNSLVGMQPPKPVNNEHGSVKKPSAPVKTITPTHNQPKQIQGIEHPAPSILSAPIKQMEAYSDEGAVPRLNTAQKDNDEANLWSTQMEAYSDEGAVPRLNTAQKDNDEANLWSTQMEAYSDEGAVPRLNTAQKDNDEANLWSTPVRGIRKDLLSKELQSMELLKRRSRGNGKISPISAFCNETFFGADDKGLNKSKMAFDTLCFGQRSELVQRSLTRLEAVTNCKNLEKNNEIASRQTEVEAEKKNPVPGSGSEEAVEIKSSKKKTKVVPKKSKKKTKKLASNKVPEKTKLKK